MEFRVDSVGPCRKKISVTIPPARILEEFDKKYGEINDNVAMPGFRPGRAPRKLLEKRFGGRLGKEVRDDLVKAALEQMIEEKKVDPLAPPDIDLGERELVPEEAFDFEFEMITKPEFETPAYKELEVRVAPVTVNDEEIDTAVDGLRRRGASLQAVKEEKATVEEGDVLVLDWRALDGDSVEARDDNVFYPFGRGVLAGFVAEGLDDHLRGQAVGARAQTAVRVAADDPREELRGRELNLEAELKAIRRYVLPEVDEAFLKKNDFDDVDEMRADLRKQIQRAKAWQRDAQAEQKLVEQLLDTIEISLPEEFVEQEVENWASRKRMSLQMEKTEDEEISKQIDAARSDTKAAIERDMQRHFLLDRVAETESIEVTETEMMQAIEEIASVYGHPVEQVLASFRDGGRLAELRSEILHRKARQALRQHATIVEDAAAADEAPEAGGAPPAPKKAGAKKTAKKTAKKAAKKQDEA